MAEDVAVKTVTVVSRVRVSVRVVVDGAAVCLCVVV